MEILLYSFVLVLLITVYEYVRYWVVFLIRHRDYSKLRVVKLRNGNYIVAAMSDSRTVEYAIDSRGVKFYGTDDIADNCQYEVKEQAFDALVRRNLSNNIVKIY